MSDELLIKAYEKTKESHGELYVSYDMALGAVPWLKQFTKHIVDLHNSNLLPISDTEKDFLRGFIRGAVQDGTISPNLARKMVNILQVG